MQKNYTKYSLCAQLFFLTTVILLGIILKTHPIGGPRMYHEIAGGCAWLFALITLVFAFKEKQPHLFKILAVVAFLLISLAAIGGEMTQISNFMIGYYFMIVSALSAYLVSLYFAFRLRLFQKNK